MDIKNSSTNQNQTGPDVKSTSLKALDDVSFSRNLLKIFAIPIFFIVISMTISHLQFEYRDNLRDRLDVLSNLEHLSLSLMKSATEMEMAQKGYSLSNNSDFLDIYQESYKKLTVAEEQIFNITVHHPELHVKFGALTRSLNHWQSNLYLVNNQNTNKPRANKDLIRFDKIRENYAIYYDEIQRSKAKTRLNYKYSAYITYALEILCAMALAIFIYFLLKKQIQALTQSYRKLIEQNQEHVKSLEEASKAKDLFLANMSHEIRTPLGAVIGFADLVSEDPNLSLQTKNQINFIKRNANHLLGLVEDLFDLSKVVSQKLEVQQESVLLLPILNDIKSNFENITTEKNIDLQIKVKGKVPTIIETDPLRLKQILINLIGNAIKFSETHSFINLDISYKNRSLIFDLKDNGIGIKEKEQSQIFDSFHQADVAHSRKYSGAGLGLSIAKNFAELLNGTIKLVSSKEGIGSHFRLELPAILYKDKFFTQEDFESFNQKPLSQYHKEATDFIAKKSVNKRSEHLNNVKILLAEDSRENQILYKTYLESVSANVEVANNGSEAVRKALTSKFDIVLMDIQMPNVDGYEAMKILKDSDYDKKIIALTAHALKDEKDKCLRMGFDGYISKPVTKSNLISIIKSHLNNDNIHFTA